MTIQCLTFDLDDTLWAIYPVIDRAELQYLNWMETTLPQIASAFSREELSIHRHSYFKQYPELHHDLTQLRKNWSAALMTEFGYDSDRKNELIEEGFAVFWQERNTLDLFEGVEAALDELKKDYKIGAVTNGNADLNKIGIDDYFNFYLTSAKAGVSKPNPDIFAQTETLANCPANQIIHIGDDPVRDVEGAANCGFKTIWVNLKQLDWEDIRQTEYQPDAIVESISELTEAVRKIADRP